MKGNTTRAETVPRVSFGYEEKILTCPSGPWRWLMSGDLADKGVREFDQFPAAFNGIYELTRTRTACMGHRKLEEGCGMRLRYAGLKVFGVGYLE